MSAKRQFFNRAIYPILHFLKVPQFIRWLLDTYRTNECFKRVTAGSGVRFREGSVVHNPLRDPSKIKIGKHALIDGELLVHEYGGKIEIGDFSYVGLGSRVWSGESVKIGRFVLLAHNVTITDTNSHQISSLERAEHFVRTEVLKQPFAKGSIKTGPVEIGDHVWLNFGVGVLRGVKIGEGAIVGAGSLVTKDIPAYSLAVGNPAKVIKQIPRELDIKERLSFIDNSLAFGDLPAELL